MVINVDTMPIVSLEGVTITGVADGDRSNVNSIISRFTNSARYLSKPIPDDEVPTIPALKSHYSTKTIRYS